MYCKNCGKQIDDNAVICPNCGVQQKAFTVQVTKQESNKFGIAGFILGLLSLWFGVFIVPPITGIVLSSIGFKNKENFGNKGLTIAGLVLSIITCCIWSFYWIVMFAALGH